MHDGTQDQVLVPMNIDDIHWTLLNINSVVRRINYGDTLEWPWPFEHVERIQCWLSYHGQTPFVKAGDMSHRKQMDNYSCTIVIINIARHDIFGDNLFTDADKHIL